MSEGRIFLLEEGELVGMREQNYKVEDVLQKQLAEHTPLLAGEQINPENPLDWILIDREVGVPDEEDSKGRWSLDHLFIDQEGTPTLVEVKRAEDTRTRREVVAQMLDYAANSTQYWNIEQLQAYFEANTDNPEEELEQFLPENTSTEDFWEDVKDNIRSGDIRMIFVADEIPSELTAIVEFLNKQMNPAEVVAVEVKQYSGEKQTALVPRVKGQTEEARQRKRSSSNRKNWNWKKMKEHAQQELPQDQVEVIEELHRFGKNQGDDLYFGTGSQNAAFMVKFEDVQDTSTFKVSTDGTIGFWRLNRKTDEPEASYTQEDINWLEQRLSEITEKDVDLKDNAFIELENFTEPGKTKELKSTIREFVGRCED